MNASDRGSELWVVAAGTCKPAMEIRDHLVKFIDNDGGFIIVKSAGEAAWLVEGGGWGMSFSGILDVLPVW